MKSVYTVDEIKEILHSIFDESPVIRALIFGSYAKGAPSLQSDVDILIDCNGEVRGIDFFGILDEVTEALNVPVDLIELSQVVAGSRVDREISETGVVIYERS